MLAFDTLRTYLKNDYVRNNRLMIQVLEDPCLNCRTKLGILESYECFVRAIDDPNTLKKWHWADTLIYICYETYAIVLTVACKFGLWNWRTSRGRTLQHTAHAFSQWAWDGLLIGYVFGIIITFACRYDRLFIMQEFFPERRPLQYTILDDPLVFKYWTTTLALMTSIDNQIIWTKQIRRRWG